MVRLTEDELIDWLRLIRSDNVGPRTFKALMAQFGNAGRALDALPGLARRGGRLLIRIASRQEAEAEISRARKLGIRLVSWSDSEYPEPLRVIDSAPPFCWPSGEMSRSLPVPSWALWAPGMHRLPVWRAGLIPVRIRPACKQERLRCSPAGTRGYIRLRMRLCWKKFLRWVVRSFPKCRLHGSRGLRIFPGVTASYRDSRLGSSLLRRQKDRAP